jgi:MFS-type transporter involved in bile tolerance (Atg22 family)
MSDDIDLNTQETKRPQVLLVLLKLGFILLLSGLALLFALYLAAFLTRGLLPSLADMVIYGLMTAVALGGLAAASEDIVRAKRAQRASPE